MREELRLHIEHRADDLVNAGLQKDEALRRARVEFGAVERYKEQCRDASGFSLLRPWHGLAADFRLASRRLIATPLFTVFAVLSLAVGVGLTTAVYSIVDTVFWKEEGVAAPDATAIIAAGDIGGTDIRWVVSRDDYEEFRTAQHSFEVLGVSQFLYPSVATPSATEIQPAEAVDAAYFQALGVTAAIGRTILTEDDNRANAVVLLSDAMWRSRFGGDPNIVGQTIRIATRPFEIVGVAPRTFDGLMPGPGRETQLWVPIAAVTAGFPQPSRGRDGRGPRRYTIVGRLAPGQSLDAARAEIAAFSRALDAAHPLPADPRSARVPARAWSPTTLAQLAAGGDGFRRFGYAIVALVALVLVVACTNLANLVLARGTLRRQEFAVRRALGASRWRLVREQCAESAILAVLGGGAAYIVLRMLVHAFNRELPVARNWVVSVQPEINAPVLVASAAALLLSLLVFGLEPAVHLTRREDVRDDLASTAGSVGAPKAKRQRRLLRWQVAISAGFFMIASMTVRYVVEDTRHDSGIDLDRVAVGLIDFYAQRWDEARARQAVARILEEAQREPGIDGAAVSSGLPFGTTITPAAFLGRPDHPKLAERREAAILVIATPAYFRVVGTAIVHGRDFTSHDDETAPPVVILSASTATKTFGTANAVGRQLLIKLDPQRLWPTATAPPEKLATVVGVAEDTDTTHFFLRRGDVAYVPFAQAYSPVITLVLRAEDAGVPAGAIRRIVRRADEDVALSSTNVGTGRLILAGPYVFYRAIGTAALALGGVTLLLAMVGLYGVMSNIVSHRTREIGLRMSLGATAGQIRTMVLGDGYRPVLQGLALGLFIGVVGRTLVRAFLIGRVDVVDAWMLTLVPLPLLLAAFIACFLPARRASRIDPNVALRHL